MQLISCLSTFFFLTSGIIIGHGRGGRLGFIAVYIGMLLFLWENGDGAQEAFFDI